MRNDRTLKRKGSSALLTAVLAVGSSSLAHAVELKAGHVTAGGSVDAVPEQGAIPELGSLSSAVSMLGSATSSGPTGSVLRGGFEAVLAAFSLSPAENPWADTDGDWVFDSHEVDFFGTSPTAMDSDGDGVGDAHEIAMGSDPTSASEIPMTATDADGDGLDDYLESLFGLCNWCPDSDGDRLLDGFEMNQGLDPLSPTPNELDLDADGLDLFGEQLWRTNPDLADTDADTLLDGDEVYVYGTDPLVWDDPNVVPEPAMGLGLATGAALLAGLRRRAAQVRRRG
jgi:hypothetical protein